MTFYGTDLDGNYIEVDRCCDGETMCPFCHEWPNHKTDSCDCECHS